MSTHTPFSLLLQQAQRQPGAVTVTVPDDWMQGRSVFGGLQAALAVEAMRTLVPEAPLRALQGTFIGPVAGGPVSATARVLRVGKSVTHVEARLGDDALLIGVFGAPRSSVVSVTPAAPPVPAPSVASRTLPFIPGVTPNFTQHFQARWLAGSTPFTGTPSPNPIVEVSMVDAGPATEAHVVALADFIPPVALSYLRTPAPGSTLTWMLELLRHDFADLSLDGWRLHAELVAARDGYTQQTVAIWGPDGAPVALSRQTMTVFG